jgi:anti-sigma regulatory factor (Ser/Thr protein kinase)
VGPRESNRVRKHFSVSGPSAISNAITGTRDFAEEAAIGQEDSAKLAIIVEELVANLYDHGGLKDDDIVEIEMDSSRDSVRLIVDAPGGDFYPGEPLANTEIPERGGGAGLKLVQAWSLAIGHEHRNGRNRWTVALPSTR